MPDRTRKERKSKVLKLLMQFSCCCYPSVSLTRASSPTRGAKWGVVNSGKESEGGMNSDKESQGGDEQHERRLSFL